VSTLFGGKPDIPMVPADGYESHAITKGFRYQTFYPLARSLTLASPAPSGVELQALARTTPLSWGEMNYEKEAPTGKLKLDPEDHPGPLVLAAVATRKLDSADVKAASTQQGKSSGLETKVVVFGDSDFASNAYFSGTSDGELFLNAVNWLAGQEDLVAIGPKAQGGSRVNLSQQQVTLIGATCVLAIPGSVLIAGVILWARRRRL
jgi:ABC-type uncharacterized transport system involved in gliding motility auxiliary subunit